MGNEEIGTESTATETTETVDTSTDTSAESTEVAAEESAEADAGDTGVADDGESAEPKTEVVPPTYTPNFKYKVLGQEQDLPEEIRAFIKDEKTETYFRSIHEKAGAVDHFVAKNKDLSEKFAQTSEKYNTLATSLGELSQCVKNDDYETFFEELGIDVKKVMQFCANRLRMEENPDQFRNYQLQRDLDKKNRENQRMVQDQSKASESRMVNYIKQEYESTMSDPANAGFEKEYDKRVGRPGAFREEIIFRGDYALSQNKLKTTAEIVKELKSLYAFQNSGSINPTALGSTNPGVNSGKRPIVPVIPGSTGAPIAKGNKIATLDDLRKAREALPRQK